MRHFLLLFVALPMFGPLTTARAQSWSDFSSAVPKVSVPSTPANYSMIPVPTNVGVPNFSPATSSTSPLVSAPKTWKLGVIVRNTETGAVVQQVETGGAGQSAGLNAGDVIVAVSGARIGDFDGRIVDITDELKRSVDPSGRVSLLVQDASTRVLRAMVVALQASSAAAAGRVQLADNGNLPPGSTLTVELKNVSKPYYEIAGGKIVLRAEGVGPFPFELNYDPRYIDPRDQYQLNAFVSWNNQVLYSIRQPTLVNAGSLGQPSLVLLDRGNFLPSGSAPSVSGWPSNPAGTIASGSPGYPNLPGSQDSAALNQLFLSVLGRPASSREIVAWQSYLQQGNSMNDVMVKLMVSPPYRERFTSDSAYLQQVVQTVSGRVPSASELSYWLNRAQTLGGTDRVVSEIVAQRR